jgi:uncharacterized cofD-like protein
MQPTTSIDLPSDLPIIPFRQPEVIRTPIEHLMEFLLTGTIAPSAPDGIENLAKQVLNFDVRNMRIAILGGGTGLSTVLGGNSQRLDWSDQPGVGLKKEFPLLHSIICTTDDGGSTGRLLKLFPLIGIGDLRKILVSSMISENLQQIYGLEEPEAHTLIQLIHKLMMFRFPENASDFEIIRNPLLAAPPEYASACPRRLAKSLNKLGAYVSPGGSGPVIPAAGNSLGNILLTSAIFMAANGSTSRAPRLQEIQAGVDHIAGLIGAPVGRIHPATSTPGQLKIRYANGVEVYGQSKAALAPRNCPVEYISVEYSRKPLVCSAILKAIEKADLIVYAPGSIYTSIIPILQLESIASAIRANDRALKILGANVWIQEGETDISLKNQGRGFLVSELIEACDRNVPGGVDDLFHVVLSANLEQVPMEILRNYAFEGKSPIYLDKSQVKAMGIQPIEAMLLSAEDEKKARVIHHDARRFSLAVRALLFADKFLKGKEGYTLRRPQTRKQSKPGLKQRLLPQKPRRSPLLCNYSESIKNALCNREFQPADLKDILIELAWANRDIAPSHFRFIKGGIIVPARKWDRSTEWDNVLGYYDPQDQYLKLHEGLLTKPSRLREDILVAVGESLLGRYIESRRWIEQQGARCYEIVLLPAARRESFLSDSQIRNFLKLARMTPDPIDDRIYRITINKDGGFLPPGLLFGLTYAWYLSGSGLTMEYEMTLLRWPLKSLIPLHAKDRIRKEALVTFFRNDIFGHGPD